MASQSEVRFLCRISDVEFDVVRFELTEALSQPFRLELELSRSEPFAIERNNALDDHAARSGVQPFDLDALLDAEAVFTIERAGDVIREVCGVVTSLAQDETGFRRTRYCAIVEPPLARLGLWHDNRIHQLQSVPEIIAARLKERGVHAHLGGTVKAHVPREYCVQFDEPDLHFISRIAAEEGIAFYFDPDVKSRLTFTDSIPSGPRLRADDDIGTVTYQPNRGGDAREPSLWRFGLRRSLAPTRVTQRDRTFWNPQYSLEHRAEARDAANAYEVYNYAGRYQKDEAGKPFTQTRLLALRNEATLATLEGDDARLWPGLSFLLEDHPTEAFNRDWRVVSLIHEGRQHTAVEADAAMAAQGTHYAYRATAVTGDFDWKPTPLPRPVMDGPQIAEVVGPENEEIHTDTEGRIQVWFPWDRAGPRENSTCFVRVSHGWSGAGYGIFHVPRIGHEVIISYINGDPDQPVATSSAYHARNRPPYPLPQHKTRSVWKSNSHKSMGSNEIRFEDATGAEEIYIHAQLDQNIVVERDETTRVGHDRIEDVGNDERITVGHDRIESVGNDETLSIGQDRRETLGRDHMLGIGRSRHVDIGKDLIENVGNVRIENTTADRNVETGGHYMHKVAGRHELEAGERIAARSKVLDLHAGETFTLRGRGGTITIDDDGITVDALKLRFKGVVEHTSEGSGNYLDITGTPNEPICLECMLKAAMSGIPVVAL